MKKLLYLALAAVAIYVLYSIWQDFTNENVSGSVSGSGSGSGNGSTNLTALASAIQKFENVNPAYNNPGGVNETGDAGATSKGIAIYSSFQAGWSRLLSVIQNIMSKNPGMTLSQFIRTYVYGPNATDDQIDPNVLNNYVSSVSSATGIDPNAQLDLSSIDSSDEDSTLG